MNSGAGSASAADQPYGAKEMTKEQDHDELDRSAVGLAEASVSPANGELPFHPSVATGPTVNVKPNRASSGSCNFRIISTDVSEGEITAMR
jgi:hypothetical protein